MEKEFIFIYAKGHEIQALTLTESNKQHQKLYDNGWTHTNTLDACSWVEFLHNRCDSIANEVKSLSKTTISNGKDN